MIETLKMTIWGRDFSLPVVYDCFSDGIITDEQMTATENFLIHPEWVEKSRDLIEDYCRESVLNDDENPKKNNIFSYIKPERLYVKNYRGKSKVAIMCNYRYDIEHGLAIVFDENGSVEVGMQDIIL